jgi:hypothetical protein
VTTIDISIPPPAASAADVNQPNQVSAISFSRR